jgi:hypothetical protein
MRVNTSRLGTLLAKVREYASKIQQQEKSKDEIPVVEYIRVPRLSHVVGRRPSYYWPGRRAAASLRTAGKTRRMR